MIKDKCFKALSDADFGETRLCVYNKMITLRIIWYQIMYSTGSFNTNVSLQIGCMLLTNNDKIVLNISRFFNNYQNVNSWKIL